MPSARRQINATRETFWLRIAIFLHSLRDGQHLISQDGKLAANFLRSPLHPLADTEETMCSTLHCMYRHFDCLFRHGVDSRKEVLCNKQNLKFLIRSLFPAG